MFSENTSQKAFNTKYHEGTKDEKIKISKTNLILRTFCFNNTVAFKTVFSKQLTRTNEKKTLELST
jgi:hypothetical protein